MNLAAVDELIERFSPLDLIFIESGGDNLAATFSRKGGPGITKSDLLVINKIDLLGALTRLLRASLDPCPQEKGPF